MKFWSRFCIHRWWPCIVNGTNGRWCEKCGIMLLGMWVQEHDPLNQQKRSPILAYKRELQGCANCGGAKACGMHWVTDVHGLHGFYTCTERDNRSESLLAQLKDENKMRCEWQARAESAEAKLRMAQISDGPASQTFEQINERD